MRICYLQNFIAIWILKRASWEAPKDLSLKFRLRRIDRLFRLLREDGCRRVFDDPLTKFLAVVTAVGLAFNASWTSIAQQIDTGYEVWPKQRAGPSRTRLLQIKKWNSGFDMFWRFDTLWCLAAFLFCRVLPVGAIPAGAHSHLVALPKAAWQCPAEHLRRIVAKLAATHSCGRLCSSVWPDKALPKISVR